MWRADLAARRGALAAALAGSLLLAGCRPAETPARVVAPEGYSLLFPGPAKTISGRDGPVRFRVDSTRAGGSARLEAAWFGFPQALEPDERQELLGVVERGLSAGGAQIVKRLEVPPGNRDHVELVLDHPDGRRGYHHLLYPGSTSMLQVSAVGVRGGDWEDVAAAFFASLEVSGGSPPEAPK